MPESDRILIYDSVSRSDGSRARSTALDQIIGGHKSIRDIRKLIVDVAEHDCHVIILGENGTGKELVARALHKQSVRINGPFVAVNCGAITDTMAESEFFGHERGAFTGATALRRGFFEQADGGVVFLDEVADLSPALQVKLLRVLQEKHIVRLGSDRASRPIPVNVRVIAATNKNLDEEVSAGRFREDLYWRLVGWEFALPPLRERGRDIVELFRYFLRQKSKSKRLGRDAESVLIRYPWPGNVRELQKVVERVCIVCKGRRVGAAHLHLKEWNSSEVLAKKNKQEQVLEIIDRLGTVARSEICIKTGMTSSIAGKTLTKMIKAGSVVRIGQGRRTQYARSHYTEYNKQEILTARLLMIVEHVTDNGSVTRKKAAMITGKAIRTASRDLNRLVEIGQLVPDGKTGNSAGYVLP